jgi:hypothetical protein
MLGVEMSFLNIARKGGKLPSDIELDVPPAPPKMMQRADDSTTEAINEELMVPKPNKLTSNLSKLPPIPKIKEPELPPLPKEVEKPKKKGLFSLFKGKKEVKKDELKGFQLPDIEGAREFPELPPLPKEESKFSGMPELPKEDNELSQLPEMEEPSELPPLQKDDGLQLPEIGEPKEQSPLPVAKVAPKPVEPQIYTGAPVEEKNNRVPVIGKKFITIEDFRQIQDGISNTKNNLKDSDSSFDKLEENKNGRDKSYVDWSHSLHEMQKKIMFIDKILFKEMI